jgi:hypothetical protein
MWRRVDLVWIDVSKERIASIFRVEKSASEEPAWAGEVCSHLLTLVPSSRIFLPRRWRRDVPPKRRFTQDLHGAISQNTAFFIGTAVKTSNLTYSVRHCSLSSAILIQFISAHPVHLISALDLYSSGARFEFRPESRLSWRKFSWFSSASQGKC